jgi:hypothetical protein
MSSDGKLETSRRHSLRCALASSALLMAARSSRYSSAFASALNPERHFAPVKVSRDRIIREIVSLRPFRSEGL